MKFPSLVTWNVGRGAHGTAQQIWQAVEHLDVGCVMLQELQHVGNTLPCSFRGVGLWFKSATPDSVLRWELPALNVASPSRYAIAATFGDLAVVSAHCLPNIAPTARAIRELQRSYLFNFAEDLLCPKVIIGADWNEEESDIEVPKGWELVMGAESHLGKEAGIRGRSVDGFMVRGFDVSRESVSTLRVAGSDHLPVRIDLV